MVTKKKWNSILLTLLIVGAVIISIVYITRPACSDSGIDWDIMVTALSENAKKQGPNYDFGSADIKQHFAENCKEDLKIYNEYLLLKQKSSPICPQDFKDPNEKLASFFEWEKEFRKDNPKADISDLAKARKSFYAEHDCKGATQRPEGYKAGQIDEKAQQLIDIIENYGL